MGLFQFNFLIINILYIRLVVFNIPKVADFINSKKLIRFETFSLLGEGQWPRGYAGQPTSWNPEFDSFVSGSWQQQVVAHQHAELLRSTPTLVLCCAWLVTMSLHVHCGLGQLCPLPTSGDDK